jgi:NitT/TauT family transport system substrate-binding protein
MRKSLLSTLIVLAVLVGAVLPAYSAPAAPDMSIKFVLIPVLDVLPFYVAEQEGYFTDAGLDVEGIPVSGVVERDQLMVSGAADGILSDVIGAGLFNQDKLRVQIVAEVRRAYPNGPMWRILAAPNSGITTPDDLKGVDIGISVNSVVQYAATRILEHAGLSDSDIQFRAEPNIPVRYQLLMEGQLKAACLNDPLAQAAIEGGATLIADDSSLADKQYSQATLNFTIESIQKKPEAIQAFVAAWMKAAEDMNANPTAYRKLFLEKTNVPDSVKDTYILPPFPVWEITQEPVWDDVMQWMLDQKIIDQAPSYDESVNKTFIEALAPQVTPAGNADNGQALFASLGCSACHAVDSEAVLVGPSLQGVAERAATRVEGLSAEEYLRQSIVEPGAYVVEDFQPVMPAFDTLSESDVNDLVAYLMTLQ